MGDMLQEIKERLQKATPGPWTHNDNASEVSQGEGDLYMIADDVSVKVDCVFIAHAPTDIAFLIAEVERLQKIEAEAKMLTSWVHFGNDGFAHVQKIDFYRLADAINDTE